MRRNLLAAVVFLTALAGGCSDNQARRFLQPDTSQGRNVALLLPSAEKLQQSGRIAGHATFTTLDGTDIEAWWSRTSQPEPKGTVVLLHGLGEGKAMYLTVAEELSALGYDTLLPDLRTHGSSGGRYVTYGLKERGDIAFLVNRLRQRDELRGPLYASGVDAGGMIALRYAAAEPNVQGVFVVDPMLSLASHVNSQMPLASPAQRRNLMREIGETGNFDTAQASSPRALERITAPVLIAQGVFQMKVPASDVLAVYQAAGEPKELIRVNEITVALRWQKWMAEQIDRLATEGLSGVQEGS